jgi:NAD(P)-dependent dehydrogenase (short-subunit alcohol dehydrogenase family)
VAARSRRFEGRRALITGAASGIGLASAMRLASEGADVVLLDVDGERAKLAAAKVAALDVNAVGLAANVGDEGALHKAVEEGVAIIGGLDTVVACAGITHEGSTHTLKLEDWDLVLRVNLTGVFLTIKHTIPHLIAAGGGSIVTLGSIGGLIAAGRVSSYDASKGGVLSLTRYVADEYAENGIRANCIIPGTVETNLAETSQRVARPDEPQWRAAVPERRYTRVKTVPQQRRADPSEIASVVAFLSSDDASFMTGATVAVDGGFTAT